MGRMGCQLFLISCAVFRLRSLLPSVTGCAPCVCVCVLDTKGGTSRRKWITLFGLTTESIAWKNSIFVFVCDFLAVVVVRLVNIGIRKNGRAPRTCISIAHRQPAIFFFSFFYVKSLLLQPVHFSKKSRHRTQRSHTHTRGKMFCLTIDIKKKKGEVARTHARTHRQ